MTNRELIVAYVEGKRKAQACNHLAYNGDTLINYSTVLCTINRKDKTAHFNKRKYSNTTGRIQTTLRMELVDAGFTLIEYDGDPAHAWNYGYMGARNLTMEDALRI